MDDPQKPTEVTSNTKEDEQFQAAEQPNLPTEPTADVTPLQPSTEPILTATPESQSPEIITPIQSTEPPAELSADSSPTPTPSVLPAESSTNLQLQDPATDTSTTPAHEKAPAPQAEPAQSPQPTNNKELEASEGISETQLPINNKPSTSDTPQSTSIITDTPQPTSTVSKASDNTPPAVAALTESELKFAAALYAKRNQRTLSQAGVKARQATASRNLHAITKYISKHSPTTNASIARALNLPPRRVQHYMQILTKNGTVTATGWAQSRKYFKK